MILYGKEQQCRSRTQLAPGTARTTAAERTWKPGQTLAELSFKMTDLYRQYTFYIFASSDVTELWKNPTIKP